MLKQMPHDAEMEYYRRISKIESNDNPKAKAKTSSASGRFQFIKSTWEGLGYDWKDVFNDALQWQAIEKLTQQNEAALIRGGCAVNFATLYGAHFLGVSGLLKVMRGMPSASINTVTTAAQRKANPTILNGTVQDFCNWLERKTGDKVDKRYNVAPIPQPRPEPEPNRDIPVLPPVIEQKSDNKVTGVFFLIIVIVIVGVIAYMQLRG